MQPHPSTDFLTGEMLCGPRGLSLCPILCRYGQGSLARVSEPKLSNFTCQMTALSALSLYGPASDQMSQAAQTLRLCLPPGRLAVFVHSGRMHFGGWYNIAAKGIVRSQEHLGLNHNSSTHPQKGFF